MAKSAVDWGANLRQKCTVSSISTQHSPNELCWLLWATSWQQHSSCAKLGPSGGSCLLGHMDTISILAELTLHACLETIRNWHVMPADKNDDAVLSQLYCLTMLPVQLPDED